jgi:hypothetical protein
VFFLHTIFEEEKKLKINTLRNFAMKKKIEKKSFLSQLDLRFNLKKGEEKFCAYLLDFVEELFLLTERERGEV